MLLLPLDQLVRILEGRLAGAPLDATGTAPAVDGVSIHSRRIPPNSLFVALRGRQSDGHDHVADSFAHGAVAALVAEDRAPEMDLPAGRWLVVVPSPIEALQRLAAWYRRAHLGRVVAITGSNGKTIVKDALYAALAASGSVAASPGSFNSQLGVALSILRTPPGTKLSIFEAGISEPGDMARLRAMLQPDCGVLTNVGLAHIAAFRDRRHLAVEKLSLFEQIPRDLAFTGTQARTTAPNWLLVPGGDSLVVEEAARLGCALHRFPEDPALPKLEARQPGDLDSQLRVRYPDGESIELRVRTRSPEIIEDLAIAIDAASLLGASPKQIAAALDHYQPPPTRLEVWRSPTGITLVNDSYSADPISVRAALRTTGEVAGERGRRLFVFGGMGEQGEQQADRYEAIGALAGEHRFDVLMLVGNDDFSALRKAFWAARPDGQVIDIAEHGAIRERLKAVLRPGDTVLFKGPRHGGIAAAARDLYDAIAPNRLVVDLGAVAENVARFRRAIGPRPRILAMVKALAYGSELVKLSSWLSEVSIDMLGVSTAEEAAQVRRAGIQLPVLVMLVTPEEADRAVNLGATPVVYSLSLVEPLAEACRRAGKKIGVHLEIDTGLNRLGVAPDKALELAERVTQTGVLEVTGAMTHFAGADDPEADDYTREQIRQFDGAVAALHAAGYRDLILHAAATSAAARFAEARYDMVRLGMGLYGIYPSPAVAAALPLQLAVSLVSRINEVHVLKRGDRVGYNSTFKVTAERMRVGVVPLGYYDGIPWNLSNRGEVIVGGARAAIIGRISMDSMIVDLTGIPESDIGSEVLIYGAHGGHVLRPEEVAARAETIPYELLVRLGPRVQRIFVDI